MKDPIIDDVEDFKHLDASLAEIGLDKNGRFYMYATVAAVLHIGNIEFAEDPEDTRGMENRSPIKLKYGVVTVATKNRKKLDLALAKWHTYICITGDLAAS